MSLLSPFRKSLFCWGILLASPVVNIMGAEVIPQGAETALIGSRTGDQTAPNIAISGNGGGNGGVLVWQDNSFTPIGSRIGVARLDAALNVLGTPFAASSALKSKNTGGQEKPKVALLRDGGAVIVWQQAGAGKAPASQIYARFLDQNGKFKKSDIRVASFLKNNQTDPAVTVLADGTVVVVWSSFEQDGSMDGVFAQRFTAAGGKLGGIIAVNSHTLFNQRQPDVAALSDGGFVVAWVSELQSSATSVDIYARQFNASGAPAAGEFRVSQTTSNACATPSVAAFADGGFVVTWAQRDDLLSFSEARAQAVGTLSTNGWDIYAEFFTPTQVYSASQSPAVRVNANTYGDQYGPKVAAGGANCFIVWTSLGQDGSREGVYGQLMSNSGVPQNGEIRLNTTVLGPQFQPAVTWNGNGKYVGVWSSLTGSGGYPVSVNFDIFAQIYLQSSGL